MTFRFPIGKHRGLPLYWLHWWSILWDPIWIKRKVKFGPDTKYSFLGNVAADQADHNKLFGIFFGKPHGCSARFGWRYDPVIDKFILSAYCYLNGERIMEDLTTVVANHWYECHLLISGDAYIFRVINENGEAISTVHISKGHRRKLAFMLGPFFGGNQPVPKELKIELKKI